MRRDVEEPPRRGITVIVTIVLNINVSYVGQFSLLETLEAQKFAD